MPLPFILGGAALLVAGAGVKKAVDGFQKKSVADDIEKEADAEYICDDVDEIADVLDLEEMMVRR